jgi:AbrB family looped-hinge helix DNA binding protein
MLTVKTLAKGQIVIPAALRRRFGIEPGALLELRVAEDHLQLHPLPADPIAAFRGSLKQRPSLAKALAAEHRREVKRDAKR